MKRKRPWLWFIFILFFTFAVAFGIGLVAEVFFTNAREIWLCSIIIAALMLIAFMGDIVAVAVAYAELPPFNAMASKKIKGARVCIKLVQSSDKVSSILSDVLGDVCGIISGVVGATLSIILTSGMEGMQRILIVVTVTAVIAALTVAVKSLAKKIAIKNCTNIVSAVGKFLSLFARK